MRMCWVRVITKVILLGLTISSLSAQGQIGQTSINTPPTLGLNSFTTHCTQIMSHEIMDLADKEAVAEELKQSVLQVKINIRRLAIELITQGDRAENQGIMAVFNGLRFFLSRAKLDESLDSFETLGSSLQEGDDVQLLTDFAAAYKGLVQFNEKLLNAPHEIPVANTMQFDRFIEQLMWPLIPAVEIVAIDSVANHWPTRMAMQFDNHAEVSENQQIPTDLLLKRIGLSLEEASLRDDTHKIFITILDLLERGSQFPEFQHRIKIYCNLLIEVLEFASALENTSWLDDTVQQILKNRLHTATILFEDRNSRTVGEQHFDRLLRTTSILMRISKLENRRIDVKPIGFVFEALIGCTDPNIFPEPLIARRLWLIVERMIIFRELVIPKLPRDFRIVMRKLNEDYLASEIYILDNLEKLTSQPDALINPALSSLLSDQRQYLEDLQRTVQLPQWISTLSQIVPKSANTIEKQLQKVSKLLIEPNSRPGAIADLDKLGEQIRLFNPLPFESLLYSGNSAVIKTTGGRHKQLTAAIVESRKAWAQAWADGVNIEETAAHMMLLYRFTQLQGDAAGLFLIEEEPLILNRWAAWDLPTEIVSQRSADLPTRLKLATAAAIDGDDQTLAHQLDRIDLEVPFAKLVGRLHMNLSQSLAELPDGALSIIGQTTSLPSVDAWGIPLRIKLAQLCRYTIELQHAYTTRQAVIAKSLETYVNQLASVLLDELNENY